MLALSILAASYCVAGVQGRQWGLNLDQAVSSDTLGYPDGAPQQLSPRHFEDLGSKRTKLKYGPFLVPSAKENMGMKSFTVGNMSLPCRDCYITAFAADIEFPDGTYANANTSMWLHHMAVLNENRNDTSCPRRGANHSIERTFAAGNERTFIDLTLSGKKKAGYYLNNHDSVSFLAELMNEAQEAKEVVVTIDWEYVPGTNHGFQSVVPVWIDVDGVCGSFTDGSEVPVPNSPVFDLSMEPSWTTSVAGEVVMIMPHLHDGGVVLDVSQNNKVVCSRTAQYGESPGFISPMTQGMGMDMDMDMDMLHISSMETCTGLGRTEIGDKWEVKAAYNMTQHPGMIGEDMKHAPVMGIAIMFIAV